MGPQPHPSSTFSTPFRTLCPPGLPILCWRLTGEPQGCSDTPGTGLPRPPPLILTLLSVPRGRGLGGSSRLSLGCPVGLPSYWTWLSPQNFWPRSGADLSPRSGAGAPARSGWSPRTSVTTWRSCGAGTLQGSARQQGPSRQTAVDRVTRKDCLGVDLSPHFPPSRAPGVPQKGRGCPPAVAPDVRDAQAPGRRSSAPQASQAALGARKPDTRRCHR